MLIALTLDVINTVKYFDLIWVMTAGGPANRTEVLSTLIYRLAFQFFRTGRAAALAMVMVAALAVFSIFYVRLTVRDGRRDGDGMRPPRRPGGAGGECSGRRRSTPRWPS